MNKKKEGSMLAQKLFIIILTIVLAIITTSFLILKMLTMKQFIL